MQPVAYLLHFFQLFSHFLFVVVKKFTHHWKPLTVQTTNLLVMLFCLSSFSTDKITNSVCELWITGWEKQYERFTKFFWKKPKEIPKTFQHVLGPVRSPPPRSRRNGLKNARSPCGHVKGRAAQHYFSLQLHVAKFSTRENWPKKEQKKILTSSFFFIALDIVSVIFACATFSCSCISCKRSAAAKVTEKFAWPTWGPDGRRMVISHGQWSGRGGCSNTPRLTWLRRPLRF